MKFTKISTILFTVFCLLVVTIESTFALPFLSLSLLMLQQPLFSDQERVVIAIVCGVVMAVLYHLPLAVGIALVCGLVAIYQSGWWTSRTQTRDALSVMVVCTGIFFAAGWQPPQVFNVIRFIIYSLGIVAAMRLWLRRRKHFLREF